MVKELRESMHPARLVDDDDDDEFSNFSSSRYKLKVTNSNVFAHEDNLNCRTLLDGDRDKQSATSATSLVLAIFITRNTFPLFGNRFKYKCLTFKLSANK